IRDFRVTGVQACALPILLAHGASVSEKDGNGRSALIWAAWYGYTNTVHALLDSGAAIGEKDNDGRPALMWAAGDGHTETVRMLKIGRASGRNGWETGGVE